jgi:Mrp family chromosome partitioning ATPase
MDNIRQALERARELNVGGAGQKGDAPLSPPRLPFEPNVGIENPVDARIPEFALNVEYLESKRIIAHDDTDPRSKPFDMLRTQVLQPMDQKGWKILGITSPTPGCGKTVTAINLAFSIARQPDRSVLLVDLDLQKPQVANSIGVKRESGVVSVLEGRTSLSSAIIQARVGNHRVMVLPVENSTSGSSALVASRAMSTLLQEIRRDYRSATVILDLPPMLSSDDVIAVLPQLDCVLLVAAVGTSTVSQIEECNNHLHSAEVIRFVLNKVPEWGAQYYYSGPRPA